MDKKEAKVESIMEIRKAIAYVEDLVAAMKKGRMSVLSGEHAVTLSPAGAVKAEIKASQKPGKESISFKLSWRTEPLVEGTPSLRIDSELHATAGEAVR